MDQTSELIMDYSTVSKIVCDFIFSNKFCQVVFTSGTDESLDLMWTDFCDRVRSPMEIDGNQVYVRGHKWNWGAYRVPYIKGKSEKFAGCFAEHSLAIVGEPDLIEPEVFEVFKASMGLVILINGPNV